MSVIPLDGKICRVCLVPQRTSKFNLVFGNNGRMARQIFEVTGLKLLEFQRCPALICPKCTASLQRACEFRTSILESNKHFNELYRSYSFSELDFDFTACGSCDEYQTKDDDQNSEIKIESNRSTDLTVSNVVGNYQFSEYDEYICADNIKMEAEDGYRDEEQNIITYVKTVSPLDIKSEDKEEFDKFEEFIFEDLPHELLLVLDDDNFEVYPCTFCDHKSCSEVENEEHIKKVHRNNKKRRINAVRSKTWNCSYCGENFNSSIQNVQHRRSVHNSEEKSLTCRFCFKQFSQSLHLRIHLKYSHIDKVFVCRKCNKKFNNLDIFRTHIMMESMQCDYVCKFCSTSFHLQHHLTEHMKIHKKNTNFLNNSNFCEESFHEFKVVDSKSFKCGTCQQTFSYKHHLKMHMTKGSCREKI